MTASPWSLCSTLDEFVSRCDRFCADSTVRDVPVLRAPWHSGTRLPGWCRRDGVDRSRRLPGAVFVDGPSPVHRAMARVLAVATGRAIIDSWEEAARYRSIAMVGPAEQFTAEVLVSFPHSRVGVITGYDDADISALIARTLLFAPRGAAGRTVTFSTTSTVSDVRAHTGVDAHETELAVLTGHGRECCVQLSNGVLCAAEGVPASELPGRPATCATTGKCYFRGYPHSRRVSVTEMSVAVVLVDSCQTFAVGTSRFGGSTRLPLSFMHGEALAVVGTPWVHAEDPVIPERFRGVLAAGGAVGDAVCAVNESSSADTSSPLLMLLGDPELKPMVADESPAAPAPAVPSLLRSQVRDVLVPALTRFCRYDSFEAMDEVAGEASAALVRLPDVPDETAAADIARTVRRLDLLAVRTARERCRAGWYHHAERWWDHGIVADRTTTTCPDCRSGVANRVTFEHWHYRDVALRVLSCPRCGVVEEGHPEGPEFRIVDTPSVRTGTCGPVTVDVTNPGSGHAVAFAAEVLSAGYYRTRVVDTSPPFRVADGGIRYTFDLFRAPAALPADLVRIRLFAASGGRLTCRTLGLYTDLRDGSTAG